MKTRSRLLSSLAVLSAMLAALGAIFFLSALAADADLAAVVMGSLAVYVLGAMTVVEYNRSRRAPLRRWRVRAATPQPVLVPMRHRRRERERLAA